MSKAEILWNNFVKAHADYLAGRIPLHERQKAFIVFKSEFIGGTK